MNAGKRYRRNSKTNRQIGSKRHARGEAIISVALGGLILVPICLLILDIVFLVLVNSANDTLAHNAARAAANQQDQATAYSAAQDVVGNFHTSVIVPAANLINVDYAAGAQVVVKTTVNVKLPAPLPVLPSTLTFVAQDAEAVVGTPSTL